MDLTVVIVNYNVCEFLKQALTSVTKASEGLDTEIIVVDNNSADRSVQMVRDLFPSVKLIANSDNRGFGAANNQALRVAEGRNLLLLNPDTIVQEDTLRTLSDFLDQNPQAGAVGCKILNPDGSFALESRRSFPTPAIALARMTGLSRLFPRSKLFGRYNLTYNPVDASCEVDALSGSCMMIRRSALTKSGAPADQIDLMFDEQFFMYGEDLDLCYRIQQAGWKLYYEPTTQIIHYKGESTKKGDLRYVRLFYGAMLLFAQKHFQGRHAGALILLLRAGIFARGGLSAVSRLVRRLTPAVADFAIAYACFAGAALWRFADKPIPSQIITTVAPAYGIAIVVALALLGAYRFGQRTKSRYPLVAAVFGLVSIAALSFFFKQIAFSRFVVGVGSVAAAIVMLGWRFVWSGDRDRARRALLVGPKETAARLHRMLKDNPAPPFDLVGYVDITNAERNPTDTSGPPLVGRLQQLRDIARIEQAGCVIFVPGSLTNEDIFGWMQSLRHLPIQFKMLGSTESHVIGKSSIDQLSLPALVEAEQALGLTRSNIRHRLFDTVVAFGLLAFSPVLALVGLFGNRRAKQLLNRTDMLPSVVAGRRSIVGFDETTSYRPPKRLGIKPGLFAVAEGTESERELDRRYGFYAIRQSAGIDWAIMRRRLSE
ncbi:MAG: glycosyltransferase [Rhodothermales bacterium]|nr:glycosyltransferase [Rhodothermales bacterium]